MPDHPQFARDLGIDGNRLQVFLDRGWITPPILGGKPVYRDVDVARAALINDLSVEMGVWDDDIDLVLDLLDQLYDLRSALNTLIDALEHQPWDVRRDIVEDALKMNRVPLSSRSLS